VLSRERYLVIDGHKRVAALEQLGRDTVEATVWAMSEAEALQLSRSLRSSPQESALEEGWLARNHLLHRFTVRCFTNRHLVRKHTFALS
jgi:ParB-like chromosome segregation protein Spo0J